ncbi:diphthine--ammonia ligase [Flavobacterium sediminilitoris]|uniref:Diphthine--ammonia ligase n=1 Tax=Flavobacterium sediminilitoris TaxID=2024526 RepID=A0ABY4HJL5_9FLAO|nr:MULTISPECIES: diphthine--ammonia ligase [Flavobacterium]UOX32536.1 diphthine--ammonia ligase [Flavobacterium sediminilitoris]
MKVLSSWSGGKDSCYALMQAVKEGLQPTVLLNMMNENGKVSRSHGIPLAILEQQATQINVPLVAVPASWSQYEENYIATLHKIKEEYQIEGVVFGDIDLESHREWEEKVCKAANLKAFLPLWQQDRIALVNQMLNAGIETMIVSCNLEMGENYLGKILTKELALELEAKGIDPCGENGEFHTLVINCPLFRNQIQLPKFEVKTYDNYCFVVWE